MSFHELREKRAIQKLDEAPKDLVIQKSYFNINRLGTNHLLIKDEHSLE
jgi:hypothetical protein